MEIEIGETFYKAENGEVPNDGYRYLLTRIHERGSIVIALCRLLSEKS